MGASITDIPIKSGALQDSEIQTIEYLSSVDRQIHENIKFADQKAQVFITLNSGIIGALYAGKLLVPLSRDHVVTGLAMVGDSAIIVSMFCTFLVLFPRSIYIKWRIPKEIGRTVMPERIAGLKLDQFWPFFISGEGDTAIPTCASRDLCALVWIRAKINRDKYVCLMLAIALATIGWLAIIMMVLKYARDDKEKRSTIPAAYQWL